MLHRAQLEALSKRAAETLESGQSIGILGWRINQHTDFTRKLNERYVRFYDHERRFKKLGKRTGFVLLARGIRRHTHTTGVPGAILHNTVLETREIIFILESCINQMQTLPSSRRKPRSTKESAADPPLSMSR